MRMSRLTMLIGAAIALTVSLPAAQQPATSPTAPAAAPAASNPRTDQFKRDVGMEVDAMGENIQKMNDMVFSFAEPGFQEFETSKYLTTILKQNGFTIQEGIAGIPTAWTATWGSGKPVIALGSDIDDIPQASQKPGVAWHEPIIEGAPGHGEGHNSGMPLQIAAALGVKKVMEQQHLQGTLMLWPGVAEELLGTKAYYVRAGIFKNVDICIFAHVGANMNVGWGDSGGNGMVSVEYDFKGESAHAAGAPWRGRSALDAVELMDVGWNFRREHLRIQQRSHYVIPNGGDQPERRPAQRLGLVLLPRDQLRGDQEALGHRQQDGQGRDDDDRHRGDVEAARLGVAGAHEQDRRRDDAREHREGRAADVDRGGSGAGQGSAARDESAGKRPRHQDQPDARPRSDPG